MVNKEADDLQSIPTGGRSGRPAEHRRIIRRLLPLYIGAFLQGSVLWYAIEKLFLKDIGFDDATIGLMVAICSVAVLAVETPSGILADRWSRKGVLVIGSIALVLSSLVGGLSQEPTAYLVSAAIWGVFAAMYSGTYDSIVYDTLKEETGHARDFAYYLGRVRLADSAALVAGSLAGGLLANATDLRLPYLLTIIPGLLSIAALLAFREPHLHLAKVSEPLIAQIRATFRALVRNRILLLIVPTNMLLLITLQLYYEFDQLWLIALLAPTSIYGAVNALLLSGGGVAGLLAGRFNLRLKRYMVPMVVALLCGSIALTLSRSLPVAIAALGVVCITIGTITIVYTGLLHNELSSDIRAGASSAVSSLAKVIMIPLALCFGWLSKSTDIFTANLINTVLISVICVLVLVMLVGVRQYKKTAG